MSVKVYNLVYIFILFFYNFLDYFKMLRTRHVYRTCSLTILLFFYVFRVYRPNYASFLRVDVHERARSRALNPINRDRYRAPGPAAQSLLRPVGREFRAGPADPFGPSGGMKERSEISQRPYKAQTAAIRPLGSNNAAWTWLFAVSRKYK